MLIRPGLALLSSSVSSSCPSASGPISSSLPSSDTSGSYALLRLTTGILPGSTRTIFSSSLLGKGGNCLNWFSRVSLLDFHFSLPSFCLVLTKLVFILWRLLHRTILSVLGLRTFRSREFRRKYFYSTEILNKVFQFETGMRHIFLYFFPYALFVYPTLSIYLIIAKRSTGRSGQLEKDGKVGKQNSTNQTDQSHYNIAEIPRQHKPPDCSPVHEPDPYSGPCGGQSQLYQHCCSSLEPQDATTFEVELMEGMNISRWC